MVSIKRYLTRREGVVSHEIGCLLLLRIGAGAAIADDSANAAFRADLQRLSTVFSEATTIEEQLQTMEAASQLIEDYNRQITLLVRRQRQELKDIVSITAEIIETIDGENARSGEKLRAIGNRFQRVQAITDLDSIRTNLSDCLHAFRDEIVRQQREREELISSLRLEIERGPRKSQGPTEPEPDAATGLPQRQACVRAMHASIPAGNRRFVVTLVVNRLQAVNRRFGREVGDRVLCRFCEFIEQQLLPHDRLFRWSGPTLVALLERSDTLEQIRQQVRRILDVTIEETLDVEGRFVMIPVSAAWSVFQLIMTPGEAAKQIDGFAAGQEGREYV